MQDKLGDRMKRYESTAKNYLTRRVPAIIRIDGKAFHSFTKGFARPFDGVLHDAMNRTMQYLCANIQGCVFGYTQSDEITLVLTDYATIQTDAWFGYSVQKMCSIAASMATLAFNKIFAELVDDLTAKGICPPIYKQRVWAATFDARAFNVPVSDVCNCLIWRQKDATRNSIMAVGQANFSAKRLHKQSCDDVQEMLFKECGINWNDYPTEYKRGVACYKVEQKVNVERPDGAVVAIRHAWHIDTEIPIFTQDRTFIEKWL